MRLPLSLRRCLQSQLRPARPVLSPGFFFCPIWIEACIQPGPLPEPPKRKQGRSPVFPSIFRWPGAYARHTPGGLLPRRLYPPLASLSFPGSGSGTGYGLLTCLYSASSVPVKAAYSVRSACSNGSGSKIW